MTTLYTQTAPDEPKLGAPRVSLHTNDRLTNGTNSWYRSTSHTARQKDATGVFLKTHSARTSLALDPGAARDHTAMPSLVSATFPNGAPPSSSYMSSREDDLRPPRGLVLDAEEASPPRSLHRGHRRPRYFSLSRSFFTPGEDEEFSVSSSFCCAGGDDGATTGVPYGAGRAAGRDASAPRIVDTACARARPYRGST